MQPTEPQYYQILIRLADAGVEAIVVGMASAVIQGVPSMTWDLDIVHRRTPGNIERLLGMLASMPTTSPRSALLSSSTDDEIKSSYERATSIGVHRYLASQSGLLPTRQLLQSSCSSAAPARFSRRTP